MKDKNKIQLGDLVRLEGLEKSASPVSAELKLTDDATGSAGVMASKIEHSEALSASEVEALASSMKGAMENMKVDYFGDEMTMAEFLAIPDLDKNSKICKEIEAGDYSKHDQVTYLSKRVAEILARESQSIGLNLTGLRVLSVDALTALLHHYLNDLHFPSLDPKLLEDDVLKILVENDYDEENDGYEIIVGDEVRKMMEDYKEKHPKE